MSTDTRTAELDLDAIEARATAATRGPWTTGVRWEDPCDIYWLPINSPSTNAEDPHQPDRVALIRYETCGFQFPHFDALSDAAFIAHARQDIPALLAEVRRLREQLAKPCGSCHPCTNYADETWRKAGRKPPHVVTWDDTREAMARVAHLADQYEIAGDAETAQRIRKALHIPTLDELLDAADA